MLSDIRFAIRIFFRERVLFGVTLAGLAFAIGISTSVFTVLNATAFRGYGVSDPAHVYGLMLDTHLTGAVSGGSSMQGVWGYADYERLARNADSYAVAASARGFSTFKDDAHAPAGPGMGHATVSGNYFDVMGAGAARGRILTPADNLPGAPPVVVLSHQFWMRTLQGNASIVGRTVWLDDTAFMVVGVAARFFTGPTDGGPAPPFWIPITAARDLQAARAAAEAAARRAKLASLNGSGAGNAGDQEYRRTLEAEVAVPPEQWNPPVTIHARPIQTLSRTGLGTEISALATAFAKERGLSVTNDRPAVVLESLEERRAKASSDARVMLLTGGAIVLVILLASANLANLLLAGAIRRGREIATRLALGAGRRRVMRQLITESLMLGVLGGAAGLLIAAWLAPVFAAIQSPYPERLDVAPDAAMYLFVTTVALAVGMLAGLAPIRYCGRGDLTSALKADQAGASNHPRGYLRSLLIGGQAAASIILLVIAALFTRAAVRAATFDLGFDAEHLLEVSVGLGRGYDEARINTYWATALDRLRQLPGVAAAAVTEAQPFGAIGFQPWQGGRTGLRESTSAEYFEAVGVAQVQGRAYTPEEVRNREAVAVISASVARLYWGTQSPIGDTLDRVWGPPDRPGTSRGVMRKPAGTRIVGVVADTVTDIYSYDAPTIYIPSESLHANTQLIVRSTGDPAGIIGPVRDVLRGLDPEQRPGFMLIRDRFQRQLAEPQRKAEMSAIIGVTALGLAAIGLFGVTAFVAGQRRREIGVRVALGAGRRDITGMLVRDSLRPVLIGLAGGMLVALWIGRGLQDALFGLSGWDPIAIAASGVFLLTAAAAAAWLPARRAARVDPAVELRAQ